MRAVSHTHARMSNPSGNGTSAFLCAVKVKDLVIARVNAARLPLRRVSLWRDLYYVAKAIQETRREVAQAVFGFVVLPGYRPPELEVQELENPKPKINAPEVS